MPNKKVYVLELVGDIQNTPGAVTLEIGGVSLDKKALERLKVQKDKELDDYLGSDSGDTEDDEDEDEDDYDDGGDITYMNYDLDSRPEWTITEHDLVTK